MVCFSQTAFAVWRVSWQLNKDSVSPLNQVNFSGSSAQKVVATVLHPNHFSGSHEEQSWGTDHIYPSPPSFPSALPLTTLQLWGALGEVLFDKCSSFLCHCRFKRVSGLSPCCWQRKDLWADSGFNYYKAQRTVWLISPISLVRSVFPKLRHYPFWNVHLWNRCVAWMI